MFKNNIGEYIKVLLESVIINMLTIEGVMLSYLASKALICRFRYCESVPFCFLCMLMTLQSAYCKCSEGEKMKDAINKDNLFGDEYNAFLLYDYPREL